MARSARRPAARGVDVSDADSGYHLRREAEEILASVAYEQSVKGGWLGCFRVKNKTLYRTFFGTRAPVPRSPRRL